VWGGDRVWLLVVRYRHPTLSSSSWAPLEGSHPCPCILSVCSGRRECNILKRVMTYRLRVVQISCMYKMGKKQVSCRLQLLGRVKTWLAAIQCAANLCETVWSLAGTVIEAVGWTRSPRHLDHLVPPAWILHLGCF
jgi:hypothetical protein